MDSAPPATTTSASPPRMALTPRAMASRPEEQKRLTVMAAGRDGDPGQERRLPSHVHPLLRLGHGAPQDDVVDAAGLEGGHAGEGAAHGGRRHVIGASRSKRPLRGLPHRRPNAAHDHGVAHGYPALQSPSYPRGWKSATARRLGLRCGAPGLLGSWQRLRQGLRGSITGSSRRCRRTRRRSRRPA